VTTTISQQVAHALEAGGGILHLAPTWVPRAFLMPGKRMRLAERDLYAFGAHRGGIDERWFASTTRADNGPETREDEGLSYVMAPGGERFLFLEAVEAAGAQIIGERMMREWGRWPLYCKFFDNLGPIPHHLHQLSEHVEPLGREHKPEAYYFPPQLNPVGNAFPYTFFGLEPGTRREDIRRCLERWKSGDNGILELSKAYRLRPGTGWLVPPGILHAPGSLLTYEVQWGSDVFAMFQSLVEGRFIPWELLVKDVPEDKQRDLDYLVDLIDWDANVNPTFKADHYLEPIPIGDTASEGYQDRWVIYGKVHGQDLFSAKELSVQPGASVTVRDGGACGAILVQGRGRLGVHEAETTTYVRYGEPTRDEFFITEAAARGGYRVENTGHEPLVILRYFGPGASPDMPAVGAYREVS
jgi:hypothetical protein